MEFLSRLFDTSDFPARWNCGHWSAGHGWLHILSDLGVWAAYLAIPCVLAYFVLQKKDLPFRKIFLLFVGFILFCGTTHLMEAIIFWWPAYRLAGIIKLATAVISWATVAALIPIVPRVLAMRSPEELEREIVARQTAEANLQGANDELEKRVEERTAELRLANAAVHSERELLLRVTLRSIGDAVTTTDAQGRVTFLNEIAQNLMGWTSEEAQGKPLEEVFRIVNEMSGQTVENPVERALREGRVVGLANHTILIGRSGKKTPIEDSAAPIRDEAGHVAGVILIFRDVTERKMAEKALRESEAQFRTLADSIPQLAWMTKPDGYIFWYNQRWYDYTGTTLEQMNGWGWQSVHDPVELPRVMENWKVALGLGLAFEDIFPLRRHDGQMRWHLTRAVPVRDDRDRILCWFGTNTDITEERARIEAGRQRTEQLRAVAQIATQVNSALDVNTVMGLVTEGARTIIGAHQCIASLNADRTSEGTIRSISTSGKYAIGERNDGGLDDAVRPSMMGDMNHPIRMTQADLEAHPSWKNSQEEHHRPALRGLLAAPLIRRRGNNLGFVQLSDKIEGDFTDDDEAILVQLSQVTAIAIENARLYREMRDADRRKDEFLATLAHELRNPLAPIRNALHLMRESGEDKAVFVRMRDMMDRQLNHMVRLVDDLLDVSRITRGKIELRQEVLPISDVLELALETSRPLILAAKHELTVTIDPQPIWVRGDKTRLAQIVANLLNNSAKYTPEGGRIDLSAQCRDSRAIIRVRDNGMGIPAAMLPKIFEMFTQVDQTLEHAQGGLGIGLTLVRRLAEMHGGTVEAHSEGTGQGSEFRLYLDTVVPPIHLEVTAAVLQPVPKEVRSRRVLVVDDNKDSAESLGLLLSILGNDVRTAHDGPSAIQMALEHKPDLIMLDIGLPGMNGYEVARVLREKPEFRDVVLIAQTGWGQEDDRRLSSEAGFNAHLVKPVDLADLKAIFSKFAQRTSTPSVAPS